MEAARAADAAIIFAGLPDSFESEGYDRSQNEESESERAALPTGDDEADNDADDTEGDEGGDDFDTDDDVFDFDDVPSFEDISLDDLDDK